MRPRGDHPSLAQKIGLTASVLALGAIGLLTLTGKYLPPSQALFLLAVAGFLTLVHAVSYVSRRYGKARGVTTAGGEAKHDSEFSERHL